jgi:hypothetical protein
MLIGRQILYGKFVFRVPSLCTALSPVTLGACWIKGSTSHVTGPVRRTHSPLSEPEN